MASKVLKATIGKKHRKSRKSIVSNRKRCLGQGNVFIGVCHSFCPQGGWLPCMHHRPHDWGVCFHAFMGSLHLGDLPPGKEVGRPPSRDKCGYYGTQSTSRRYASYLNAFLLQSSFHESICKVVELLFGNKVNFNSTYPLVICS